MKHRLWLAILLLCLPASGQRMEPSERPVEHFAVEGVSRLAALAKLGWLTRTSLLVEAGGVAFLQASVTVSVEHATVADVAHRILRGGECYLVRSQGLLLVVSA